MKQFSLFFLSLFFLLSSPLHAEQQSGMEQNTRPKVAVVLSGGGAKGMSHVAVLEAIEEAGIPIDIVVGTSMGSIIGGLYCTGYSPKVMRQIVENTDWMKLILDNPDYGAGTLSSRKNNETYILRVKAERARRISKTGFGGLIEGDNVLKLLSKLLEHIPDSIDFDRLPVPFACVATDLEKGEPLVLRSGNMPLAIRTSMSIPTVFTPVILNGRSYIDGGIVNNFPVDVARQMGADIVIGADIPNALNTAQISNNSFEVLNHVLNLRGKDLHEANIANVDIYMPINVKGYSAGSFDHNSIDSLFVRGENAYKFKEEEIIALREKLHIDQRPDRIRKDEFYYDERGNLKVTQLPDEENVNLLAQRELDKLTRVFLSEDSNIKSAIGLGLRFDSEEYASFLLEGDFVMNRKKNIDLNLRARLGNRMEFAGGLDMSIYKSLRLGAYYKLKTMAYDVSYEGSRTANYDLYEHLTDIYLSQEWAWFYWEAGLEYNKSYFSNGIMSGEIDVPNFNQHSLIPYAMMELNTLDRIYFPTRGMQLCSSLRFYTDCRDSRGEGDERKEDNLTKLLVNARIAYTPGRKFTMIPHFGMALNCNSTRYSTMVTNGVFYSGLGYNIQMENQIPFVGFSKMQYDFESLLVGGLTLQQRIKQNQYLTATVDHLRAFMSLADIDYHTSITGISVGYNIKTLIGPLTLEGRWNDQTRSTYVFFNLGYLF